VLAFQCHQDNFSIPLELFCPGLVFIFCESCYPQDWGMKAVSESACSLAVPWKQASSGCCGSPTTHGS